MNMRSALVTTVLLATLAPLAGCHEEGPAERAGKGVDGAVRDAKDVVSPPGPVEKAGRTVDDAVNK